uniref:Uncharacterized protein n=1 Tax=Trichuris muris TaxID=70415 RepID=A0A5S6QPX0_TRIMR
MTTQKVGVESCRLSLNWDIENPVLIIELSEGRAIVSSSNLYQVSPRTQVEIQSMPRSVYRGEQGESIAAREHITDSPFRVGPLGITLTTDIREAPSCSAGLNPNVASNASIPAYAEHQRTSSRQEEAVTLVPTNGIPNLQHADLLGRRLQREAANSFYLLRLVETNATPFCRFVPIKNAVLRYRPKSRRETSITIHHWWVQASKASAPKGRRWASRRTVYPGFSDVLRIQTPLRTVRVLSQPAAEVIVERMNTLVVGANEYGKAIFNRRIFICQAPAHPYSYVTVRVTRRGGGSW